jgi:hypothetical protein
MLLLQEEFWIFIFFIIIILLTILFSPGFCMNLPQTGTQDTPWQKTFCYDFFPGNEKLGQIYMGFSAFRRNRYLC